MSESQTKWLKGGGKKRGFSKKGNGSGGRTVCPRGLSFSQFVVLMSTPNGEKDSLLRHSVHEKLHFEILSK